jgi:intergrase/recombinase
MFRGFYNAYTPDGKYNGKKQEDTVLNELYKQRLENITCRYILIFIKTNKQQWALYTMTDMCSDCISNKIQ